MNEVYDDFLTKHQFKSFDQLILSNREFPWYWNDGVVLPTDGKYQFTHMIYSLQRGGAVSKLYPIFEPLLVKLKVKRLVKIKLNLNPKTFFHRGGGWHVDNHPNNELYPSKTAVFYLNTNNGWTSFKKGGRVKSKSNRIVIFDSSLEHQGVTCTDENRRVIVNLNYDI